MSRVLQLNQGDLDVFRGNIVFIMKLKMNLQQKRLLELIKNSYSVHGGTVDNEQNLQVNNQQLPLKPLLCLFDNIANSKEFTLLSPLFDTVNGFPLADMYVELAVSKTPKLVDPLMLSHGTALSKEIEIKHQHQRAKRLTIDQAIHNQKHRNIVILGDPGSGKTSLLKYLTLSIAKGESSRWLIPIHISLRQYWQEKKNYAESGKTLTLAKYGAMRLVNEQHGNFSTSKYTLISPELWNDDLPHISKFRDCSLDIENILSVVSGDSKENILFLLDGFDELASQKEAVDSLTLEIKKLSERFSWVLTSRHAGFYGGLYEDMRYEMISLHNQGIEDLVSNWFDQVPSAQHQDHKNAILSQIQSSPRLLNMARNPFLLTLLCYIRHHNNRPLPLQRSEIYEEIIKLIRQQLRYKTKNRELFGKVEYDYLKKFCYYLYTQVADAPRQLFSLDHWQECATSDHQPPSLDKHFLASRLINNWQQHDDYHFSHLTFQEYFIALHLSNLPFEEAEQHVYKSHWNVVFRFLAGIYWRTNKQKKYMRLLNAMVKPVDLAGFLYIEAAWILVEAGLKDSSNIIGKDLRDILWDTWCEAQIYKYTLCQTYKEIIAEALATLDPDYVYDKILQQYDVSEIPKDMIFLLGNIISDKADKVLVDLFFNQDTNPKIENAVISAIARKSTPEIRKTILDASGQHPEEWMNKRLTSLAKETRHTDFTPYLLAQLERVNDDNFNDYILLYEALYAVNDPVTEEMLTRLICKSKVLNNLPSKLLKVFSALYTEFVQQWFVTYSTQSTKVLAIAIENNWLDVETVVAQLKSENTAIQSACIEAINTGISSGENLSKKIETHIAEIAFSDHKKSINALRVLAKIEKNQLNSAFENTHLDNYRQLLDSQNMRKVAISIQVLGYMKDLKSLDKIIELSQAEDFYYEQGLAVDIIIALANLAQIGRKEEIIQRLKSIIADIKKMCDEGVNYQYHHEQIFQLSLEKLIYIDVSQMGNYLDFPRIVTLDIMSNLSTEKGFLFFQNFYITPQGKKHNWGKEAQPVPHLDSSISANEQQDKLRQLCQHLIDNRKASKAGKYIKGNKQTPLFKGDDDYDSLLVESITRKTGEKLLNGENIKPEKAQLLMDWIANKFDAAFVD